MVMPGRLAPSSGLITCTMPRRASRMPNSSTPNSAAFCSSCRTCLAAASTCIGMLPNTCSLRVGVEWSMVARVRSGRRTPILSERSMLNACGEVTSWMRCKSTYSTAGVSAVSGSTSCARQTLSNSVLGVTGPSRFGRFQPGHAGAELSADFLDRVAEVGLHQLRVLAPPVLGLGNPLARELALLDFAEDLLHLPLGRLVHDARTAGEISILGRLADEAMHLGDAALMQQVDDELELVQAFIIGHRRLIAGLDQRLVTLDHELGGAPAEHGLLT